MATAVFPTPVGPKTAITAGPDMAASMAAPEYRQQIMTVRIGTGLSRYALVGGSLSPLDIGPWLKSFRPLKEQIELEC